MKKIIPLLCCIIALPAIAQNTDSIPVYRSFDTVTIVALGKQAYRNIPYSIVPVNINLLRKTPRTTFMQHLSELPSVSAINSGNGINKPVIRGLSFNHIQLFTQGTRVDNQTWDDRHDIGISDNGFDKAEVVNGPAALMYGPNTMGGAIVMNESAPQKGEKARYVQLGFFGNSIGANLNAGIRAAKNDMYYSAHLGFQLHTNYLQGGGEKLNPGMDMPLAANSKFTTIAFKGMIGVRKEKREHRFTYNVYDQLLGIVEDEGAANPGAPPDIERDYEMEAPYQNVMNHILSAENTFHVGKNDIVFNAGYQFNKREEFEPGNTGRKSKFLGVGLNLQTITGEVQYVTSKQKPFGVSIGVQAFHQNNENTGSWVLVPDAHINTVGGFAILHYNLSKLNVLGGVRVDNHKIEMFKTIAAIPDTFQPPIPQPQQALTRTYTPFSFNLGLVFHATTSLSIKINMANGYAAPNYAQLASFGKHEGTYRFEVGENALQMEQNMELDAGLVLEKPDVDLSLNGYVNSMDNYIYITPTADSIKGLRIYRWVQNDATISGYETDLEVHPQHAKWFEGSLRIGITRGKLKDDKGDLPYIPATKVISRLTFKKENMGHWHQSYISLQGSFYGKQENVAQFELTTGGYALADIFIGTVPPFGKHERWNLVLFCTNLLNKGYFNHLSLVKSINIKEQGLNAGIQARYAF